MKNLAASEQGFTLVELLIALFLLLVGFLSVIIVLWLSMNSGRFSRDMTTAASLGQDMMERVSALSYSTLPATGGGFASYTAASVTAAGFTRQLKVEDNTPEAGIKTVTARITWNSAGKQRTRDFTVLKRDY